MTQNNHKKTYFSFTYANSLIQLTKSKEKSVNLDGFRKGTISGFQASRQNPVSSATDARNLKMIEKLQKELQIYKDKCKMMERQIRPTCHSMMSSVASYDENLTSKNSCGKNCSYLNDSIVILKIYPTEIFILSLSI